MGNVVTFKTKGKLKKTYRFLRFIASRKYYNRIEEYAKKGVSALEVASPLGSGKLASSWDYKIYIDGTTTKIVWTSDDITNEGVPIAILLQYGHATKNGGYVQGFDFINPALTPIFQEMVDEMWKEVCNA